MKRLLSAVAIALAFYACQKEFSASETETAEVVSLQDFLQKNKAPFQKIRADAAAEIAFAAAGGTGVYFPGNAFTTPDGTPVTGDISIELREIYTPAQMILNNTPTTSNGRPLVSGGEFFVWATQNNQQLKLAPGKFMRLNLANAQNADMREMLVFKGDDSSSSAVNWIPDTAGSNAVVTDSVAGSSTYLFTDGLNWINCDKFVNEPPITFTINAGNSPNRDSTIAFVHLNGLNSVLGFPFVNSNVATGLAIAAPATVVGICVVDKQIYYSMIPVTMQAGGAVTLNFTPVDEAELKKKLATLN